MVTLTYEFYKDNYFGELTEKDFNKNINKATVTVLNRTNNKIYDVKDTDDINLVNSIKFCICNVIDKLSYYDSNDGKVVSSHSSGKVSESYVIDNTKKSAENDISDVIKTWLSQYGYTNFVWI